MTWRLYFHHHQHYHGKQIIMLTSELFSVSWRLFFFIIIFIVGINQNSNFLFAVDMASVGGGEGGGRRLLCLPQKGNLVNLLPEKGNP